MAGQAAEQDLVDAAWLQRLRRIHQLQSAWWVFATAEHSRFQHALGAMHLAGEWARHLHATLMTVCSGTPSVALVEETMRMAGLLHDVGHGPFGHFFDENYLDTWGIDHEVIGRTLITGSLGDLVQGLGASPTADFEPGERIDPRWVAYLIAADELDGFAAPAWLAALKPALVGAYSADNMDYVPRDSYICGVAAGPVDVQRILHYSFISERGLTLHAHAAEALYMFLNARLYLYHQVYFHRTVRRIDAGDALVRLGVAGRLGAGALAVAAAAGADAAAAGVTGNDGVPVAALLRRAPVEGSFPAYVPWPIPPSAASGR